MRAPREEKAFVRKLRTPNTARWEKQINGKAKRGRAACADAALFYSCRCVNSPGRRKKAQCRGHWSSKHYVVSLDGCRFSAVILFYIEMHCKPLPVCAYSERLRRGVTPAPKGTASKYDKMKVLSAAGPSYP